MNPYIFFLLNFSLKRNKARRAMNTGESKQTNKAGNEGPINSIDTY